MPPATTGVQHLQGSQGLLQKQRCRSYKCRKGSQREGPLLRGHACSTRTAQQWRGVC